MPRPISASEDYSEFIESGVHSNFFLFGGFVGAALNATRARGEPSPSPHTSTYAPTPEPDDPAPASTAMSLAVLGVVGDPAARRVADRAVSSTPTAPPSQAMVWPTTYSPARDARKMARPAMSCGVPTRPLGLPRPTRSQSTPSVSPRKPTPVEQHPGREGAWRG